MRPGVQKERNVAISIGATVNLQNADTFILKNFAVFIQRGEIVTKAAQIGTLKFANGQKVLEDVEETTVHIFILMKGRIEMLADGTNVKDVKRCGQQESCC